MPFGGCVLLDRTCRIEKNLVVTGGLRILTTSIYLSQIVDIKYFAKFCFIIQIFDGTKTGQDHRKIKSRTLFAGHPLP